MRPSPIAPSLFFLPPTYENGSRRAPWPLSSHSSLRHYPLWLRVFGLWEVYPGSIPNSISYDFTRFYQYFVYPPCASITASHLAGISLTWRSVLGRRLA